MNNKKSTKRTLVTSVLSLILCMAMLIGTTFAWFTDSVTSANNVIQSGTLDVVLEYKTNWADEWAPVDENTKIFKDGALYEPGYTEVVYLRVSNAGSLALKYLLSFNIANEESSTNVYGEEFFLSDYLQVGTYVQDECRDGFNYADILMPSMFGTRENALKNVDELNTLSSANAVIRENAPILPGEDTAQVAALVLTMPETVGNEANTRVGEVLPYIELGVRLYATQYTHESDSFNNEYDKDATYTISVNSTNELVSSFENMTEATVFDATGISIDVDTVGTTTDEIIVPTFSIPTGATVKGAEFKIESNSMISAEATAVSDTVVFDECDIVTADADVTDGMPAMAIVGEMGTSVSSTKYVFNNCTFEGYIMLNGINAEFNNCTFVLSNENDGATYCSFGEYVFNNCTFNYENGTNLIASNTIYADSYATVVLNDCTLVGATYGNSADSTITVE